MLRVIKEMHSYTDCSQSREPKTERLYLSAAETVKLIAALGEPVRTIVVVAVLTGLRIGELLALR